MTAQNADAWVPEDSLANRLLLVRRALGLSQRAAAEQAGITFGEWQSLEDGRAARDVGRKVAAISNTFRVDRDWLMWGGTLAEPTPGGPVAKHVRSVNVGYPRATRSSRNIGHMAVIRSFDRTRLARCSVGQPPRWNRVAA